MADASRLAEGIRLDGPLPGAVVIVGMGGSAVAGDLLQGLWHERAPFPVHVVRGYTLPAWIGPDSLVVASSYSGGTEETLSAFAEARSRGGRALVVTSGGPLAEESSRAGIPWVRIPSGFPPRAALAYLLAPVLAVIEASWPTLSRAGERDEAIGVLARLGAELCPESPLAANPAKQLAVWLTGRTPAVYGTDATAPVAYRWRTQLEENAKVLALSGILPEMNHIAIEAWGGAPGDHWAVVFLRDATEHPRVARRAALTRSITEARVPTREVWARGEGRLARLLSLVLTGDWVSYYLALVRGVDPWAVDTLEAFKQRMTEETGA